MGLSLPAAFVRSQSTLSLTVLRFISVFTAAAKWLPIATAVR
jgi:hypothetical protein